MNRSKLPTPKAGPSSLHQRRKNPASVAGQARHRTERRVAERRALVASRIDISEQKRGEEALRKSEERYRTLFDNMTEGFALGEPILDSAGNAVDHRLLAVNEAFYVQTGLPRGVEGRRMREVFPQLEQSWIDRYAVVARTGQPERFDDYNASTRRHYDVYAFSPSSGRWAVLGRDITEQKRIEDELRKFKVFSDHSSESNLVVDSEGRIRYANRQICERLGYSEEELLRLHIQDLNPDATEALFREMMERGKGGDLAPFESIRRRKDGSIYPVEVSATVLEVEGEWLTFSVARDITERKRAEQALKESEERFRLLYENAPIGIVLVDQNGVFTAANKEFLDMTGYAPEEVRGMTNSQTTLPEEDAVAADRLEKLLAGKVRINQNERRLVCKDGSAIWIRLTSTMVRDQLGKPQWGMALIENIADRKKAEAQIQALNTELENRVEERTAQLQESNEALLQSNAELKHFAHATAHDLQTPLRSIAGFTQLLQKEVQGRVSEQVDEWSAAVVENTKRLQLLIQEILSYTRLEVQGRPFEMTDLRRLFDEVLASLAALIGETGAEVTCGALPTLAVDRTQLAQVFQNLIENGIKYNRSTPPRVAVAGELEEDRWVFSVADNGIGIDPRHYDRVFELFQRLHAYHQVPGAGIGLPLCRRIVERHGGHMWIESRLGEGSTFYFSLPADRDEAA